jgi:hypothetical protein
VIGTTDAHRELVATIDELGPAVRADVVERTEAVIVTPHDEQRVVPGVDARSAPGLAELLGACDEVPGTAEQLPLLPLEPGLAPIRVGRQQRPGRTSEHGATVETVCFGQVLPTVSIQNRFSVAVVT